MPTIVTTDQHQLYSSQGLFNSNITPGGAQTFDVDICGFTALHFASYHGNPKMIDLLIEAGANPYATNRQEINMLHVAA